MHKRSEFEISLRLKVILFIVGLFLGFGILDFAIQRLVVMPSILALERDEANTNLDRVVQAIDRETHHLGRSAKDWASWNDTYEFAGGNNPGYVADNLYYSTFTGLNVNSMYFYNAEGQVLWGKSYNLETGEEFRPPILSEISRGDLPPRRVAPKV